MTAKRECGTCTACCKTKGIEVYKKPEFTWCTYCTIGKGCRIYPLRPQECQTYSCMWLDGFGKEDERPDKVKYEACMHESAAVGELVMLIHELRAGASAGSPLAELCKTLAVSQRVPFWVIHASGSKIYFPKGVDQPGTMRQTLLDLRNVEVFYY